MDTYWDDSNLSEEEIARLERRMARRAQMQKEKRLQLQRRKRARRMIILGFYFCVFLASIGILGIFISRGLGKIKEEKEIMNQWREEEALYHQENQENNSVPDVGEGQNGSSMELVETEPGSSAQNVFLGKPQGENNTVANKIVFSDASAKQVMYSENIFSTNTILVDADKDIVVAAKGEKERISPASMTKVLTILVAAEKMKEEQLEDTFTMTIDITDYSYINDCSYVGFLDGEKVKVKDLFYGTILQSGADAAVGLATYIAGSHEAFVEMMNQKLKELGIDSTTHFTNCVGLYDQEHYSTVYDMAVIMKAALSNEFCREVLSARTYTTQPTMEHPEGISISNWFIRRIEDKETGGMVLGAKTGYVNESKSCAVSYGEFGNRSEYICVTVGAHSSWRCIYDHVEIYNQYITG